ncbi:Valine--tRNA ligase [Buchnera aphidicola (Pterocallis alni)]|uniref:valine--tRNA ligase n=1 Tax=Buchnera aphidicola TaxID=9 RepID=UPI003464A907
MKKKYNPTQIEYSLYLHWKKKGYFKPHFNTKKKNFCIIMPPPNITGYLHMGHAFQQTIMDILIRYHRMQGDNTLWQMGLDHAGIATQIIVSKKINIEEKKNLHDIGRKNFIKKCWDWKDLVHNNINYQIQRLGSSVDWNRERFTLDDKSSKAIRKVFINLYHDNLIYRKKKLSNWDIELQTVVSDLEIENKSIFGKMWYIRYPIYNNCIKSITRKYLTVATTRPETLLGDVAIAVHPLDMRYKNIIGKFVIVPFINRCIPIVSDNCIDMYKGTGCVKITPAHDMNDYQVALRNSLPIINIFDKKGYVLNTFEIYDISMNISNIYNTNIPKDVKKLYFLDARMHIINFLDKIGMLSCIINDYVSILYGERSGSKIETLLTDQWYMKTDLLSKNAIKIVTDKKITFFPKQYKNMYLSWMNNIQDWCISRQLWWGHRIPAWYDDIGNIYVGNSELEIRKKYFISDEKKLIQDPDVLDTWFSSSLWTFVSLDWPKKNNLLKFFHPTSVLISGFDIIFFWVARMIMMTLYCLKDNHTIQVPFKKVYITGLILDEFGKKMSKSKGNVLDPIDMIDGISLSDLLKKRTVLHMKDNMVKKINNNTKKQFPHGITSFGADSLRFTFASLSSINRNINWDMNRLKGYRNFCTKIWNAGRFICMHINDNEINIHNYQKYFLFFDLWLLIKFNNMIRKYRSALDCYRFDVAAHKLYNFFWHTFCDWYLEIVKIFLQFGSEQEKMSVKYTMFHVFETILKIAHPIIPFITEYIWKKLKNFLSIKGKTIMLQSFPNYNDMIIDNNIVNIMSFIKKVILFIRNVRTIFNISSKYLLCLFVHDVSLEYKNIVLYYQLIIKKIAYLENIMFVDFNYILPINSVTDIIHNIKCSIVLNIIINPKCELIKVLNKIYAINLKINILNNTFLNKKFLNRAPKNLIIQKKNNLSVLILTQEKLLKQKNILQNYIHTIR